MLKKVIKDALNEKKHDRLSTKEVLELSDEEMENYIESLHFIEVIDLLMDISDINAPLPRVISPEACKDLNEILDSDFKTVEVKDIVLFLNSIASDALNDEEMFFIYGVIAMLKCMYEEKRKGYKPKHAKTSTD